LVQAYFSGQLERRITNISVSKLSFVLVFI